MGNPKHLMWIDVETTDLDPHKGKLLEVALVLTRFDDDFSLLHTFETEISLTEISLRDIYPRTDPIIIEMHNKNGLWNTCLNSSMNLRLVKDRISDFLNDCENIFDDVDLSETPLAGSGVHFDREWLNAHLDVAARRFSHKNFDVSTLKMAARAWADYDKLFPQEPPDHHRAMADVKSSIDTALRIRQLLSPRNFAKNAGGSYGGLYQEQGNATGYGEPQGMQGSQGIRGFQGEDLGISERRRKERLG